MKKIISENKEFQNYVDNLPYVEGSIISSELAPGYVFTFTLAEDLTTLKVERVLDLVNRKFCTDRFSRIGFNLIDTGVLSKKGRTTELVNDYVRRYFQGYEVEVKDHEGGNNRIIFERLINRLVFEHFGNRSKFYQMSEVKYGTRNRAAFIRLKK
jgi:hypothetical protein